MCTSLCVMNRGRLLANGTADEVRHQLGSTRRVITITLLERAREALDWLSVRHGVHDPGLAHNRLSFGFTGDDEAQADLVDGLVRHGVRMRAFEEKRSSFEDLLVEVAENNRNS
jgi:ABC-2 type transport system ATP-binding protein